MAVRNRSSENFFLKGVFTLAKGALFARLVGLISIPILTRIYSPEDFGILAIYTAIVAILAPVLTLRYPLAIPLPKTDVIAINLFVLSFLALCFMTLIIALILAFYGHIVLAWFDMLELSRWWLLIVLGVSGTGLYELFSLWATRKKKYLAIAKTQVSQSFCGNVTKIVLGVLGWTGTGLLVGQFIAQSGGVGSFIGQFFREFKSLVPRVTIRSLRLVALYYKGFPIFRLPSSFLMITCLQAPVLMMASIYDREVAGQFSLAMMAISLPVTMVGAAISKAYYAEISSLGKNNLECVQSLTRSIQKKLFIFGFPVTIVAMLIVVPAFRWVFGSEWQAAGWYALLLMPYILFKFTSSPLDQVLNIVAGQHVFLVINLFRLLGFVLIYGFGYICRVDDFVFVATIASYMMLYYMFMSLFIMRVLNKEVKKQQDSLN